MNYINTGLKSYALAKESQFLYHKFYNPLYNKTKNMLRGTRNNNRTLAKYGAPGRIQRLERKVAQIQPEKKVAAPIITTAVAAGGIQILQVTNLALGPDSNERNGDKIRLHRINIVASADTNEKFDLHLVRPNTPGTAPAVSHFTGVPGGWYTSKFGWALKSWSLNGSNSNSFYAVNDSYKFKKPMTVSWDDNTSNIPVKNRLYLVAINRHSATQNIRVSAQIHYTDV